MDNTNTWEQKSSQSFDGLCQAISKHEAVASNMTIEEYKYYIERSSEINSKLLDQLGKGMEILCLNHEDYEIARTYAIKINSNGIRVGKIHLVSPGTDNVIYFKGQPVMKIEDKYIEQNIISADYGI